MRPKPCRLSAIPHDGDMPSTTDFSPSEPTLLRRYVSRATGEIFGLRAVLPEDQPCARIDQDLSTASWRLSQYWSWSEAGTQHDAASQHQASQYLLALENAARRGAELANAIPQSQSKETIIAIIRRICALYNAPMPTFHRPDGRASISIHTEGD